MIILIQECCFNIQNNVQNNNCVLIYKIIISIQEYCFKVRRFFCASETASDIITFFQQNRKKC